MSGTFKVIKITKFSEINDKTVLPKSDLALQDDKHIYQFKFHEKNKNTKTKIKPGIWTFMNSSSGVRLEKTELRRRNLLLEAVESKVIIEESSRFFSRLDVYEKLNRPKKRGILIYSTPGMGKSASISHFCNTTIDQDPGTVVLIWPTSKVDADDVSYFLSNHSEYTAKCTKLVLIMEDIGGAEFENQGRASAVDSGILNLLDGVTLSFKLPTLIIATTNFPENLLASLADRPGRFDMMIEIKPPSGEARIKLLEFISKRELTDSEKKLFKSSKCDGLSIAHLDEIVVRSMLHDKTLEQTLNEIIGHKDLVKEAFSKVKKRNVGFLEEDDF